MKITTLEKAVAMFEAQLARFNHIMQSPCPDDQLRMLPLLVERELGRAMPSRWYDLLRMADGFSDNGLEIYASATARDASSEILGREFKIKGIIPANKHYRDQEAFYNDFVLFAKHDNHHYGQIIATGEFVNIDEDDIENFWDYVDDRSYASFDEMMIDAISMALIEQS